MYSAGILANSAGVLVHSAGVLVYSAGVLCVLSRGIGVLSGVLVNSAAPGSRERVLLIKVSAVRMKCSHRLVHQPKKQSEFWRKII